MIFRAEKTETIRRLTQINADWHRIATSILERKC